MVNRLLATAIVLCAPAALGPSAPAAEPAANVHPAVVRVIVPNRGGLSLGSGALVAVNQTHGLVVTNWHVVRDQSGPITVAFPDGFRSAATLLRTDRDWDLAALATGRPSVSPIPLASEAPRPGEMLTIAGYGKGWYRVSTGRCTQYVSPGGNLPFEMVELATPAREGDSGGPILNSRGELAGVLFGSSFGPWGRTTGSYCGRVRWFLASVVDDFHRLPGDATMIAQQPQQTRPSPPAPAAVSVQPCPATAGNATAAVATGREPAVASVAGRQSGLPGGIAAAPPRSPASPAAPTAAINRPLPNLSGPGPFDQAKTILALVGVVLLLFHGLCFLGRATR